MKRIGILKIFAVTVVWLAPLMTAGAQSMNAGESLYQKLCASCHGADLQGGIGSSFVDGEWDHGNTREETSDIVENGLPELGMPGFGSVLTDEKIDSIIDYIHRVEDGNTAGNTPEAETIQTLDYQIKAEVFADSLKIPWAIDFLNDELAVVTERPGRLRLIFRGELQSEPVSGTPSVLHEGQGGLLDVTADPDFGNNGWIYLAYSHALPSDQEDTLSMTRIVRGRINDNQWVDQQVLFEAPAETYRATRHHYGSKIVFDPDGYLYFSIGDRGGRDHAQDLSRPNGKIHRILPDGSIPEDNPFVDRKGALPSVFTYGHRNPQGLAVHPVSGRVWDAEHGPRGGDELNLLTAGLNYGWPVIAYGINYDGTILTRDRRKEGLEQPNLYWRPSIAVSGIEFYDENMFPYWKNRLLVGALAQEEVRLLNIEDDRVIHQQVILKDKGRVRDVAVGPEGAVYVVVNEPGQVLKLSKVKESLQ